MPRHATGLKIVVRPDTGSLTIVGTVAGHRVRQSAKGSNFKLAKEEAAAIEAELLRTAWHGQRRGTRPFAEAALSYLEAEERSEHTKDYVRRILLALGDVKLSEVDQGAATLLRRTMLPPNARPSTYLRQVVTPLRAILRHAEDRGWCEARRIKAPKIIDGRTRYLLPDEAERLIVAAASHLQPLLIFLLGTGARMAEAIYLDWRDVDLRGANAIFWADRTKAGKRRDVFLPPRVIAALANLPHRSGPVFLTDRSRPYADRGGNYGGQIKTGFRLARERAGLDSELSPHDLRHTWASWQYALDRDLLRLKLEGGWSSVLQVQRYAHLLPAGHEEAIRDSFGHDSDTDIERDRLRN